MTELAQRTLYTCASIFETILKFGLVTKIAGTIDVEAATFIVQDLLAKIAKTVEQGSKNRHREFEAGEAKFQKPWKDEGGRIQHAVSRSGRVLLVQVELKVSCKNCENRETEQ